MKECMVSWNNNDSTLSLAMTTALALMATYLLYSKLVNDWHLCHYVQVWWIETWLYPAPLLQVDMTELEASDRCTLPPNPDVAIHQAQHPNLIQCYDPSTSQHLGTMPAMNAHDVHVLCQKAKQAQISWARTSFAQRRQVLRTLQRYMVSHTADCCRVSSRDSGKPMLDALLGEVLTTCEKIRTIVTWGEVWLRPDPRPTGPLMVHKYARVEYVPLGVVAPIAPWNYPVHNQLNHVISGIMAGNAVVGKVSEHTSWSSAYLTRLVRAALQVHGHNPDLCQTVTGFGDAGVALCSDPLVDKIIFTGSPAIGKKVMATAAQHLKPVILELGGKDAMVIVDDCHLPQVLPWVMRGCFQNCGQNCVGIERVLVYESRYEEFLDLAQQRVQQLRQGVPLAINDACDANVDCGSMVTLAQMEHLRDLVQDAVAHGARVLVGGQRNDKLAPGQFFHPTIVADVTFACRLFQEEAFGPIMTVVKVPHDSDEECVRLVNQCTFGLGASVYCTSQRRGLSIGRQIRSGMLCVNDFGSNYLVQAMPFGGVGDSGFGRFAGPEGLRALCLERSILTDRIPGVKTTIPSPVDYPINKEKGFPFAASLLQFFYSDSIAGKIKGILGLVKYS